jgi:Domain of unknown function (DUF4863)
MNQQQFTVLIKPVMETIAGQKIDQTLADDLSRRFPAGGEMFKSIEAACHDAIAAGWMCNRGAEGRRFGRIIEPTPETNDLSVDVVQLKDVVGPHHSHPKGEICMTMPITPSAKFDGKGAGWCVYDPGSAHNPTVTDGEALVLYLLPEGQIEFTR